MSHKYLNDIGIKSNDICIFNTESIDKDRQKCFKKQRKKYGFDERETWSMDYTMATWIYSHFMWYKKHAPIDLTYHKFNIPAWDKEKNIILEKRNIEVNQKEAINLVLKNIKYYIKHENGFEKEKISFKKFEYALKIISILMPAMWW